ncbi:MAG: capsular biosynthesis protein [Pikeienuella sp.]
MFWRKKEAINYRGSYANWSDWLTALIKREGVTDVLYYADQLPYHRVAREIAEDLGVRPWVMEFGYLRPDWLTLEPGGMGRASLWPKKPSSLLALAKDQDDPDMAPLYTHSFAEEAVGEVLFNLTMVFGWPFFPRYKSDKYQNPVFDYLYWLLELARERKYNKEAEVVEAACGRGEWQFHLVAMQLQSDYQIRRSTDYDHLEDMLDEVAKSFAAQAPENNRLVIKLHPLDNGSENWPKRVAKIAAKYRISDRVILIKGGNLHRLILLSDGVILANSTVGLHALRLLKPVIVLGDAIYDVPGLTHQGPLDTFWRTPDDLDEQLNTALTRALAAHIQVKGSFYHRKGQQIAIDEIVRRLTVVHDDLSSDDHISKFARLAG